MIQIYIQQQKQTKQKVFTNIKKKSNNIYSQKKKNETNILTKKKKTTRKQYST